MKIGSNRAASRAGDSPQPASNIGPATELPRQHFEVKSTLSARGGAAVAVRPGSTGIAANGNRNLRCAAISLLLITDHPRFVTAAPSGHGPGASQVLRVAARDQDKVPASIRRHQVS